VHFDVRAAHVIGLGTAYRIRQAGLEAPLTPLARHPRICDALVPIFVIDEAIERIRDGTITEYTYDPHTASLARTER
jgi:hypothetical protein